MTKEIVLEALFADYYSNSPVTEEFENAKLAMCGDKKRDDALCEAVKAEAKNAYKAAFNAALALMGGAK